MFSHSRVVGYLTSAPARSITAPCASTLPAATRRNTASKWTIARSCSQPGAKRRSSASSAQRHTVHVELASGRRDVPGPTGAAGRGGEPPAAGGCLPGVPGEPEAVDRRAPHAGTADRRWLLLVFLMEPCAAF